MYTHSLLPIVLVYLLVPQNPLFAQAQQCYYPDGSRAPEYNACNSTNPVGSACCDLTNSACSTEGYCYGNAGYLYRGGCTDPLWKSPNCAKHCVDSAIHIFSNLIPCEDASGVVATSFCCSDAPGSSAANGSCCGQKFTLPFGNPFTPFPNTGQQIQSGSNSTSSSGHAESSSTVSSSSVAPSSSSSVTPSSSSSVTSSLSVTTGILGTSLSTAVHAQSANHAIKIGVAIGVPLSLLILLALGFLLFRERKGRTRAEKLMQNAKIGQGEWYVKTHGPAQRVGAELRELEEINLRELHSREMYEVS